MVYTYLVGRVWGNIGAHMAMLLVLLSCVFPLNIFNLFCFFVLPFFLVLYQGCRSAIKQRVEIICLEEISLAPTFPSLSLSLGLNGDCGYSYANVIGSSLDLTVIYINLYIDTPLPLSGHLMW